MSSCELRTLAHGTLVFHHSANLDEPAVEDRGIITASVTASLEFARLILARLGVFPARTLDAWYRLYKTGNPACYFEFMESLGHGG